MSDKHDYRVSIYLGKNLYNEIKERAQEMGLSISQLLKLLISTGLEFGKALENNTMLKGVFDEIK